MDDIFVMIGEGFLIGRFSCGVLGRVGNYDVFWDGDVELGYWKVFFWEFIV